MKLEELGDALDRPHARLVLELIEVEEQHVRLITHVPPTLSEVEIRIGVMMVYIRRSRGVRKGLRVRAAE